MTAKHSTAEGHKCQVSFRQGAANCLLNGCAHYKCKAFMAKCCCRTSEQPAPRCLWVNEQTDELDGPPGWFAAQRCANLAGLSAPEPHSRLGMHPVFGPWFSLRCLIIFDAISYEAPQPQPMPQVQLPEAQLEMVQAAMAAAGVLLALQKCDGQRAQGCDKSRPACPKRHTWSSPSLHTNDGRIFHQLPELCSDARATPGVFVRRAECLRGRFERHHANSAHEAVQYTCCHLA